MCAQAFMSMHEGVERMLKRREIEWTAQVERPHNLIARAAACFQLIQVPEALLVVRQRKRTRARAGDQSTSRRTRRQAHGALRHYSRDEIRSRRRVRHVINQTTSTAPRMSSRRLRSII